MRAGASTVADGVLSAVEERVKILLVDDQPDNLLSAEAVLECLGQPIVKATSGREALRHLLDEDFAVILLDVMMPGMDGFETATLIRERPRSRTTPIIFVTALGRSDEHLFRGYEVGAVDYLYKPIVPEVLRSKVSVFIELSKKTALLERHAELLESRNAEVQALNRHLEARVRELDVVNQELEAFSYSVSHDLRGPLNRIVGFSQALRESHAAQLDANGRLYVERVHSSATRMSQLVDDLLDFSRLTRVEMRREVVDLGAMARGIAAELQGHDSQRQADFVIAEGLRASADPNLLRAALLNLLENAWKFTRQRSRARIEFGFSPVEDAYFIRDNGAGFDMAQSQKLFRPFQRLHGHAQFEGTGIGLAIVERIIQRHGGRVWAKGEVDQGAAFYFTLANEVRK